MRHPKEEAIKSFEDLDAWKVCRTLRMQISRLTLTFPNEERYRLTDQLLRASRSPTANLAEGYGRFHYGENAQFARQARGSLYEILDHLTVAHDEGLITLEIFESVRKDVYEAIVIVNGFIRYLTKARDLSRD